MKITAMGIGLLAYIVFFAVLGSVMYWWVQRSGKRYIIAGKSLPFFFIGTMLFAQALDSNSTMGGASLSYAGGFWAGFGLSLGLGLCLIITGIFFAKPLNSMNLLTLPDFYGRRYSGSVEILISLLMGLSFIILVAGNFAGAGWIISVVVGWPYTWSMIAISVVIAIYTISGGLYSCAATDIVNEYPSAIGFFIAALYLSGHYGWDFFKEAIPANFLDLSGLTKMENGALVNWAGIAALAIGDIVALDFMERIFAAKDARTATLGCYYGAAWTMAVGVAACFMGLMGLKLIPNIADPRMILPTIALEHVPFIVGLMLMAGILAAGASTANGGILGVSTVMGRNILQKNILKRRALKRGTFSADMQKVISDLDKTGVCDMSYAKKISQETKLISDEKLLHISRIAGVPVVIAAMVLAHIKPEPGVLLILAFDVVFAGCLVPLVLGIFWKKANTPGALAAIIIGSLLRVILYYTIPPEWAGLDTLIPPVVSLAVMVPISLMTQKSSPPKHAVVGRFMPDELVLPGVC
jgi:solute:Na+ symporter, SSS family